MRNKAKELGFVRDTFEKVCRLAEVLKFFEGDDMLLDVQEEMKKYLSGCLTPTVDERIFWDAFGKGIYNPQFVFEGEELKRIREHPMALWKCRNKEQDGRTEPAPEKIR